jgi:hypothetical protein
VVTLGAFERGEPPRVRSTGREKSVIVLNRKSRSRQGLRHRCLLVALLLSACSYVPNESKSGTFGNGNFSYVCINSQDPSCPNSSGFEQPFPSAIAFGGRFSVTYTPSEPTSYPNVDIEPVSSDFFESDGEVFGALRVGTPSFVALTQDGTVLDFTSVTVEPIAAIQVSDTTPALGPYAVGTTRTYGATAQGSLGQTLAGDVPYSWTSSDPSVVAVQTPDDQAASSRVNVLLQHGGTATLTAFTSTAQGSIVVNVESSAP